MNAFAMLDALDAPAKATLHPAVYVEPNDKSSVKEEARQALVIAHLRRHAQRIITFAVPNATRSTASKLKQYREGAIYGAADLVCAWTGGVAFIEMKAATTKPRANQIEFLNELAKREHHVAVCRSVQGAVNWLASIGAPVGRIA